MREEEAYASSLEAAAELGVAAVPRDGNCLFSCVHRWLTDEAHGVTEAATTEVAVTNEGATNECANKGEGTTELAAKAAGTKAAGAKAAEGAEAGGTARGVSLDRMRASVEGVRAEVVLVMRQRLQLDVSACRECSPP